jgi:uncharacterized protein (TIGR00255 family)
MTGFGSSLAQRDGRLARVEVRSVNHRSLKIAVRSFPSLGAFEKNLRDLVGEALHRGAVDVLVVLTRSAEASASALQEERARAAVATLRRLADQLGLKDDLTARDLAQIPGLFDEAWEPPVADAEWPFVAETLRQALAQVGAMRRAEGASLATALAGHLAGIEAFANEARLFAPRVVERTREKLQARIRELRPDGGTPQDAQALEREVCFFADRADIQEEVDRLQSHVAQFRKALQDGGEVGKHLEFLAQEFLREINTCASKAADAAIISRAVAAKLAVEKIKEQAANIA